MVHTIHNDNLLKNILEYDRFIWFIYFEGQESTSLSIKPNSNMVKEVVEQFPDVTFFQTNISKNTKLLDYFKLTDNFIWDYKENRFNPRIISVKDGQKFYDQSGKECFCLETLIKMIFDLYPELIPVPTSE